MQEFMKKWWIRITTFITSNEETEDIMKQLNLSKTDLLIEVVTKKFENETKEQ